MLYMQEFDYETSKTSRVIPLEVYIEYEESFGNEDVGINDGEISISFCDFKYLNNNYVSEKIRNFLVNKIIYSDEGKWINLIKN